MSDSGVNALRSVLDIPVFGPGRLSFLTALMLGNKFSVLSMWDGWRGLYTKTLSELGLAGKCASIRSIGIQPDNRNLLAGKEDEVHPLLYEAAMKAVEEDGADVICLGSTTMHESHAYLRERLPVPIINPGPLSYKMAEAVLGLGLTHSRKAYPKPLVQKDALYHIMLDAAAEAEGADPA
jgi:allantoin racemase